MMKSGVRDLIEFARINAHKLIIALAFIVSFILHITLFFCPLTKPSVMTAPPRTIPILLTPRNVVTTRSVARQPEPQTPPPPKSKPEPIVKAAPSETKPAAPAEKFAAAPQKTEMTQKKVEAEKAVAVERKGITAPHTQLPDPPLPDLSSQSEGSAVPSRAVSHDASPVNSTAEQDAGAAAAEATRNVLFAEIKSRINAALVYPKMARERGIEGTVGLFITVDIHGKLASARVVNPSGSAVLDRAALSLITSIFPIHKVDLEREEQYHINIQYSLENGT